MPKGIYVNFGEELELINFKKVEEIIEEYDSEKISDNLTICFNDDDPENLVTINNTQYGLPALIKIKGKPNQYLIDALIDALKNFETDEIYIDEDDFYEDDFEKDEDLDEENYLVDDDY